MASATIEAWTLLAVTLAAGFSALLALLATLF